MAQTSRVNQVMAGISMLGRKGSHVLETPKGNVVTPSCNSEKPITTEALTVTPPVEQRHTFTVSSDEVARGDHAVALVWLLREMPHARRLEIRFFTEDDEDMSLEFTWMSGFDECVNRGINISVTQQQAVPLGITLLYIIAEAAKNLQELKLYSGLERVDDLRLNTMLSAFSLAGHWVNSLQTLEITCSCIESDTFSKLPSCPLNLKTIILDGCMILDDKEVNVFLTNLPNLESFQVVGNSNRNQPSSIMFTI
jgi:hypothetical protein